MVVARSGLSIYEGMFIRKMMPATVPYQAALPEVSLTRPTGVEASVRFGRVLYFLSCS